MTPTLLTCPGCGTDFEKTNPTQKYCTTGCQVKTNNQRNWGENKDRQNALRNEKRAVRLPMRQFQCEVCGKTVETREVRLRRFCSKKCKNDHHNATWPKAHKEWIRAYQRRPDRMAANRANANAYYHANRDQIRQTMAVAFQRTRLAAPWMVLVRNAHDRAMKKKLDFDLTIEWARERWTGRCELTGIEFKLGLPKASPRMFSPTVDKIDPKGGYVQSNCRFILHGINALKGEETDANMYLLAEALISNREVLS